MFGTSTFVAKWFLVATPPSSDQSPSASPLYVPNTKISESNGLQNEVLHSEIACLAKHPRRLVNKASLCSPGVQKVQVEQARAKSEVGYLYPIGQSSNVQGNHLYMQKALDVESFAHLSARLDNYSYRILAFGFPLLTIGILSGAVWANEAWGSYWSWDPKEVWALITWIVFAIYLHTRITKGWSGERSAIVASLGFFVVWFCYLGVNLLGVGLHSYGWFSK